jgi:hypothetical protein
MTDQPTPAPDPETGLAACPFCGGKARRTTFGENAGVYAGGRIVVCESCDAASVTAFGDESGDALIAERWNRRAALARPDAQPCEWCARGQCEKHGNNEEANRPDAGEDGALTAAEWKRWADHFAQLAFDANGDPIRGWEEVAECWDRGCRLPVTLPCDHGESDEDDDAARKGGEENGR